MSGDADISVPAALMGDPARARLLMALADGRALPASTLAGEARVAASTCSEHLSKLRAADLIRVEVQGRNRYYRIADERVVQAMEALAQISPRAPVQSLQEGTRANALRRSRLCYDHLAGSLGVALMGSLLETGALEGGDGRHHPNTGGTDRLSAPGHDVDYRLTGDGEQLLNDIGLDLAPVRALRRPFIRYCLDWTEQSHHLAGSLGAALSGRLFELGWIVRTRTHRAVRLTDAGHQGMRTTFGIAVDTDGMAISASL